MFPFHPEYLLPIILYAETHYKFKGIHSRLFKKEPEIIADAPYRVEPNTPIPIMLLVKDAHLFPVQLISATIILKAPNTADIQEHFILNLTVNQRYWHRFLELNIPDGISGPVLIDVKFKIKINGFIRYYHNDNYKISSHLPLKVYIADEPLPRFENWLFGDLHYHSNYTEDEVEFGAPLAATVRMAKAIGLNFFAVTDHSYDLDDSEDSRLKNHPNTPKWHALQREVEQLNRTVENFAIIPGEEVSVGNNKNENIHLLILNSKQFFEGKGDSADRWLRNEPDLKIGQVLERLEDEAIAIAAHPEMRVPFLQKILIRRGMWQLPDFNYDQLNGFQVWNGMHDETFFQGTKNWSSLLLTGKKLNLIAGNDAHGNFNRFRQIGFPFFTFREFYQQLFGDMRTGLYFIDKLDRHNLINGLKSREIIITNGPVIDMKLVDNFGKKTRIGGNTNQLQFKLKIKIKSSSEFGRFKQLKIIYGDMKEKKERVIKEFTHFIHPYSHRLSELLFSLKYHGYLRAELNTEKPDGQIGKCLTNPIWLEDK